MIREQIIFVGCEAYMYAIWQGWLLKKKSDNINIKLGAKVNIYLE